MVVRTETPDPRWAAVDAYIADRLLRQEPSLTDALDANATAGLPDVDVSPAQGRLLHLLVRMTGARRVLEVGTLGGYSAIEMARALPGGGRLVTLEIDPHHAAVARANIAAAGLADRVEVRLGAAATTLDAMIDEGEAPFDLVFIDADKPSNVAYLDAALKLGRPETVIVVDNVVREGGILDAASNDPNIRGSRALFDAIAAEPRLTATVIQTVGVKKWDGLVLAVVGE